MQVQSTVFANLSTIWVTGKELDPDFIGANSVNRRYHFPARFYLAFRGVFGQIDPLALRTTPLTLQPREFTKRRSDIRSGDFISLGRFNYVYANHNGVIFVDPNGEQARGTRIPGGADGLTLIYPANPNKNPCCKSCELTLSERTKQDPTLVIFHFFQKWGGGRYSSVEDLGEELHCPDETSKIKRLTLCAHGNPNAMSAGSGESAGDLTTHLEVANSATWLPFFNRDKFCSPCEIWLASCELALGPLPGMIADQSGCLVFAYAQKCHPLTNPVPFQREPVLPR